MRNSQNSKVIRKLRRLFLYTVVVGVLIQCSKSYIPLDTVPSGSTNDTITYTAHIEPLITSSCLGCHSGTIPQGNLGLESYTKVRNATENGTLLSRVNDASNPMPPAGLLTTQSRILFDQWVQNGYPEN